jgi:hypothetical protein
LLRRAPPPDAVDWISVVCVGDVVPTPALPLLGKVFVCAAAWLVVITRSAGASIVAAMKAIRLRVILFIIGRPISLKRLESIARGVLRAVGVS